MTTDATAEHDPSDQDFARKSTDIVGEQARRWLAENAPKDLLGDRLPSQRELGRSVSLDAIGDVFSYDEDIEADRPRGAEPPAPTQALTRIQYLKQQSTYAPATEANQAPTNSNRIWTGGYLVGRFDYDLDVDEELDAAIEESGEGAAEVEFYYDDARARDDLDDRPLWQRELDLSDDDLEPPPVPLCGHCRTNPIKYKKKAWCARCHEFQRSHKGQLPPLRLTVGRRQR